MKIVKCTLGPCPAECPYQSHHVDYDLCDDVLAGYCHYQQTGFEQSFTLTVYSDIEYTTEQVRERINLPDFLINL